MDNVTMGADRTAGPPPSLVVCKTTLAHDLAPREHGKRSASSPATATT